MKRKTLPTISLHKIYSIDGIELDSILFEPKKKTKTIIIHVHGKEGHFLQNHFIGILGNIYTDHGYSFLTFNHRGHDYMADLIRKTSSGYIWEQGGSMFDIFEDFEKDIRGVINYIKELGYSDIILQGHSGGCHKICYYIANFTDHSVSKIILLTTSDGQYLFDTYIPEWKKYSFVAKKMIDVGKGRELMPITLWSNCPVSANTFWNMTNPDNNIFVFNWMHPEQEFKNFNKIHLPILVVNPEQDLGTAIPQEETIKILKKKTASKDFEGYVIKNAVHNFLSKEDELGNVIVNWLDKHKKK